MKDSTKTKMFVYSNLVMIILGLLFVFIGETINGVIIISLNLISIPFSLEILGWNVEEETIRQMDRIQEAMRKKRGGK